MKLTRLINVVWQRWQNEVFYRDDVSKHNWDMEREAAYSFEKYGSCVAYCCEIDYKQYDRVANTVFVGSPCNDIVWHKDVLSHYWEFEVEWCAENSHLGSAVALACPLRRD